MLSVWRKPAEFYIGSSILLVRNGSACSQFERSPTQPLEDALRSLSQNVLQLKLGNCRRVQVCLSAALWPASNGTGHNNHPHPLRTLRAIEFWLLGLSLLPTRISPLWSMASEIAWVQRPILDAMLLIEPDSSISLVQNSDGTMVMQTIDPDHPSGHIPTPPDLAPEDSSTKCLTLEFLPQASPEGLSHHRWHQHWRIL